MQALPNGRRKGQSTGMRGASPMFFAVVLAGCGPQHNPLPELPAPISWEARRGNATTRGGPLVVAHGGQGSPAVRSAAVAAAVTRAWAVLDSGGDAKDSVIAGTVVMEDDAAFHAASVARCCDYVRRGRCAGMPGEGRARSGISDVGTPVTRGSSSS